MTIVPLVLTKRKATAAAIVTAVAFTFFAAGAHAASLYISPINLPLIAPVKAGAVSLSNQNKTPVRLQIRLYRWRQKDGEGETER